MKITAPIRFSRGWWSAILATTIVVGATAFVLLRYFPQLTWEQLIIYWILITFIGDLTMAFSMEAVAPSRVTIGPGERRFDDDDVAELAIVSAPFDESGFGRVQIRGEFWRAQLIRGSNTELRTGMSVKIVDRDGLMLIVSEEVN